MPRQTSVRTLVTRLDGHAEEREAFLMARDNVGDRDLKPEPFALPRLPALNDAIIRLDDADEQELRWYFRNPAVATLTRSSGAFGNQLEIASAYGYGSLPCRRCGGRWRTRRRAGKATVVDWRDGTGLCPKDHFGKRVTYAAALADYRQRMQRTHAIVLSSKPTPKPGSGIDGEQLWQGSVEAFRAQGKQLMTEEAFRAAFDRVPEELCQPCRPCQGIGVIPRRAAAHVEITAYPTGSSKHGTTARRKDPQAAVEAMGGSGVVNDGFGIVAMGELARYREVHEVVADVASMSPIAAVALEEYYSEPGGQRALDELVTGFYGLKGAAMVRAASALKDHMCAAFYLAAYGGAK